MLTAAAPATALHLQAARWQVKAPRSCPGGQGAALLCHGAGSRLWSAGLRGGLLPHPGWACEGKGVRPGRRGLQAAAGGKAPCPNERPPRGVGVQKLAPVVPEKQPLLRPGIAPGPVVPAQVEQEQTLMARGRGQRGGAGRDEGGSFLRTLERWEVPWDWRVTGLTMLAWLLGFVLTGVGAAFAITKLGLVRRGGADIDAQALYVLCLQLAQTGVGLGLINAFVSPHKPLPEDLFRFDLAQPFEKRSGWLLWGGGGVLAAFGAVQLAAALTTLGGNAPPPRESADALVQLLPIIGASPGSTAALLVVTGVCAPLLEETVFRGFLLPSLTRYMPTPLAVLVSAAAFAAAHLTPGEFPQLAALGVVLGLSYAQTRNLLTPMLIHSVWNSGVIVILTALRLEGYDIKQFL